MLQENPPRALTFSTLLNTELSSVFNIMFNCVCVVTIIGNQATAGGTIPHKDTAFNWTNVDPTFHTCQFHGDSHLMPYSMSWEGFVFE